jgi:hypothetical protein
MNEANPYAPPAARVADVRTADPAIEPPFFAVSIFKLLMLSVCTFGLYEIFWFYRNWEVIRRREQRLFNPIWRALFAVLYSYGFFARVREFKHRSLTPSRLPAGALAAGWGIFSLGWRLLPEPFWLLSAVAIVFLLPVQRRVNEINAAAAPGHPANDQFTPLNWIVIAIGGAAMLLATIALFVPLE